MTLYFTAFGAGVMSFFAPCVLPLLPGYLSMLSGFSAGELLKGGTGVSTKKVVSNALAFVVGFSLVFSLMGAAASSLGGWLAEYKGVMLKVFGVMMVLFGAHMTGLVNLNPLNYDKRFSMRTLGAGHHGSFLMGVAFALGWSPCIGPILAGILTMSAVAGGTYKGVSLLLAYSAGLAVPLLLAAFLTARFFRFVGRFKTALRLVEASAGVILILAGILLFFDRLMLLG